MKTKQKRDADKLLRRIRYVLEEHGFGDEDAAINGGDLVESVAELYDEIKRFLGEG